MDTTEKVGEGVLRFEEVLMLSGLPFICNQHFFLKRKKDQLLAPLQSMLVSSLEYQEFAESWFFPCLLHRDLP